MPMIDVVQSAGHAALESVDGERGLVIFVFVVLARNAGRRCEYQPSSSCLGLILNRTHEARSSFDARLGFYFFAGLFLHLLDGVE